jgi:hypothetical protein
MLLTIIQRRRKKKTIIMIRKGQDNDVDRNLKTKN